MTFALKRVDTDDRVFPSVLAGENCKCQASSGTGPSYYAATENCCFGDAGGKTGTTRSCLHAAVNFPGPNNQVSTLQSPFRDAITDSILSPCSVLLAEPAALTLALSFVAANLSVPLVRSAGREHAESREIEL